MGCGCGGSKRQAQAGSQRQQATGSQAPVPQGGYTWSGPERAKTAEPAEPAPAGQ